MYSRTTQRIVWLGFGRAMVAISPYIEAEDGRDDARNLGGRRGDAIIRRIGEQATGMAGSIEQMLQDRDHHGRR